MKKTISLIMALVMLCGILSVAAFAEGEVYAIMITGGGVYSCDSQGKYIRGAADKANVTNLLSTDGITTVTPELMDGFTALVEADFSYCTEVVANAFAGLGTLKNVKLPVCVTVGDAAFSGCTALELASLGACRTVGADAFKDCTALSVVQLPVCGTLGANSFSGCTNVSLFIIHCEMEQTAIDAAFGETDITAVTFANTHPGCSMGEGEHATPCPECGANVDPYCDFDTVEEVFPTCTEDGYGKSVCKICLSVWVETYYAPGHDFGEWVNDENANLLIDGTETRTCATCGETETRTLTGTATYPNVFGDVEIINGLFSYIYSFLALILELTGVR